MKLPRFVARANKRVTNKLLVRLAGRPPFAAIRHVGRTSGREYRIPINAFRDGEDFVIGLTYGAESDWVKNVIAARTATVEHGDSAFVVTEPRIVGGDDALPAFPGWARRILSTLPIREFIRLRVEHSQELT